VGAELSRVDRRKKRCDETIRHFFVVL
jgi:hypothetical protein